MAMRFAQGARNPLSSFVGSCARVPGLLQLYCNRYCNRGGTALYVMVPGNHPGCGNANNGVRYDTPYYGT